MRIMLTRAVKTFHHWLAPCLSLSTLVWLMETSTPDQQSHQHPGCLFLQLFPSSDLSVHQLRWTATPPKCLLEASTMGQSRSLGPALHSASQPYQKLPIMHSARRVHIPTHSLIFLPRYSVQFVTLIPLHLVSTLFFLIFLSVVHLRKKKKTLVKQAL